MKDSEALYPTTRPTVVLLGVPRAPHPVDELRAGAGAVPLWKPPQRALFQSNDIMRKAAGEDTGEGEHAIYTSSVAGADKEAYRSGHRSSRPMKMGSTEERSPGACPEPDEACSEPIEVGRESESLP